MPTIGIFINPFKEKLLREIPGIIRKMQDAGVNVICSEELAGDVVKNLPDCKIVPDRQIPALCDMVFAFGGDGTILRTMQLIGEHQTPVLGINVGGLGFLTEVYLEDFDDGLQAVLSGKCHVEERMLLQGIIEHDEKPMFVMNEFAIEKGRSTRVIEIQVDIDGKRFNNYVADGLIISTPTGSTGYSLSSGGPIVVPTSECIILNPICPHSLTNRPVIIPARSVITTVTFTDHPEIIVSADNQDVRSVPSRTKMIIQRAPFKARLLKHPGSDYFSLLRNKLGWGEDFRDKLRWTYNR